MEILAEKFTAFAKTLPGFGLAVVFVTVAYMHLRDDFTKLSTEETLVTALVCWGLYHVASLLDLVWDKLYGPQSNLRLLGKEKLKEARDAASAALFGPIDPVVTSYADAEKHRYVSAKKSEKKSLYTMSKKLAKPTEAWHKTIEPLIDVSKAARTVFAFALVVAVMSVNPILRDWSGVSSARASNALDVWLSGGLAIASFLVYIMLRNEHNVRLYKHVGDNVKHLQFQNTHAAAIFEVTIKKR